ncbi:MAG: M48 family metalloprotease [Pseudomonadota bacterium]
MNRLHTYVFIAALLGLAGNVGAGPLDGLLGGGSGGKEIDLGGLLKSAKDAFGDVKPEQERTIGREAAAVLLGAVPLVKDEALQRYVNRIGYWVALQSERPKLDWRFGVLDSMDVNAFASPGGYVFITKGLLLRMGSEAELAGVLAHEIAHVVERHHLQAVQKGARLDLAVGLAGTQMEGGDREKLDKIAGGFKELYSRGLDKEDEHAADRQGLVLAARAGYDPYGLPATLQTLGAMNPKDGALAFLFKTHPAPGQRLDLIDAVFAPLEAYANQPAVKDRFLREVTAAQKRGAFTAPGVTFNAAVSPAAARYLPSRD